MFRLISVFLLFVHVPVQAEDFIVSGAVRNNQTNEGIPAANIRVLGTSTGTIANGDGIYRLSLEAGRHTIVASSLAFRPDTLVIDLHGGLHHEFMLQPAEIILPEVLVTSEDPAIEIIRRAIANKKRWMSRLHTYAMDAFTRQVLRRDTAIASITESFTKSYWQEGDTLREVILQRRQTENIKAEFNYASVGRILNFNEDRIRFVGYTFVGPTAYDALDHYDYKLLRTRAHQGREMYEIMMVPLSRTTPLFEGTINIADDSYALVGVDVQPNEAFLIPFVREKELRYQQQFALYDRIFWMPVDIRINARIEIGLIGFSFPAIDFSQTSVITDYEVNASIPDSIFSKPRVSVDSTAAAYDSTFWREHDVLPLTAEQASAYQTLDSTQTLDIQFRPGGVAFTIAAGSEDATSLLGLADIAFNRVEGLHLGIDWEDATLTDFLGLRARAGYGFSDKRFKYSAGTTLYPFSNREIGFGFDGYQELDHVQDRGYYGSLFNSLSALITKNDYRDYFRVDGWTGFITYSPVKRLKADITFVSEWQRSVVQSTDFSLFARSSSFRANSAISDGRMRSIRAEILAGEPGEPLDIITHNSLDVSAEYSSPDFAGSQFNFSRYEGILTLSFPTFGRSYLFPPTIRLKISGGTSAGTLPIQRLFVVESASSGYAPFGVMKALNVHELAGTSYVAAQLEHNFRSIPFLALGIPFLYENNLELIVHGGAAKAWQSDTWSLPADNTWYYEAGFGISRILELLRVDFTWRLSPPEFFRVTAGMANLL